VCVALCACGVLWVILRAFSSPPDPGPASAPDAMRVPSLTLSVSADGRAVLGATVVLLGRSCQQRAKTDAAGLVRIGNCPAGVVTATIEARGYARDQRSVALTLGGGFERVDLMPAARLAGSVQDDHGHALAAVTLVARVLGPAPTGPTPASWTTLSAADGGFAFETLPYGHVTLEVSDGGAHEVLSLADVPLPNEALVVVLRRTAAISGRVVSAEGEPVARALVTLAGSGVWPARVLPSSARGEFDFNAVPEGMYEVRAEFEGQVSTPQEGLRVDPDKPVQLELILAPGAVLTGSVRAAVTGRPVRGASIEVAEESLSGSIRRVQADADGGFQASGLRPVQQRVTVRNPGYVTQQRWHKPGTTLNVELLPAAAISGRVLDADDRPVSHADLEVSGRSITGSAVRMTGPIQEVSALAPALSLAVSADNLGVTAGQVPRVPVLGGADSWLGSLGGSGFQTDDQGNFRLEGLPPGQLTITARKPRLGAGHSGVLTLRPFVTLDDVTISLPRGVELRGRVIDVNRSPVSHVRVDLECTGDPVRSLTTQADGGFSFQAARGDCTVWVRPLGAPAVPSSGSAHELTQHELVIVLERGTERVSGRILDERGQPLDAVSVRLEVLRSHGFAPVVLSNADGSFEFNGLPGPPYKLHLEHPEHLPLRGLALEAAQDELVLRMEAGTSLVGTILDGSSNEPVAAAEVTFSGSGWTRTVRSGPDGRFQFQHLPFGNYQLSISSDRYLTDTRSGRLELVSGSPIPVRVVLTRAASVSGDVVDALGRTVWNAQVAAGLPPDWERGTRTDHAGHFRIRGLAPGELVLSARYGAIETEHTASVRAVVGEETRGAVLRLARVVDDETLRVVESAAPASPVEVHPRSALALVRRAAGIVIERVSPGTSAARAGLQVGDVLVSVDGEPVRSPAQARGMLNPTRLAAAALVLEVLRERSTLRLRYVP
jgi:hypothetical protein